MQSVSSKSGYNDSIGPSKQAEPSNELTGWEDPVSISAKRSADLDIISIANQRVSLASVLKSYQIPFQVEYSSSGWTHKTNCPFPDHQEKTPSFGYNPKKGVFNCFGCQRGGKAVQFIAAMENKSQTDIARVFIKEFGALDGYTCVEDDSFDFYDDLEILDLLVNFIEYRELFLKKYQNNSKAKKYSQDLTYSLDIFIMKHLAYDKPINTEQLKARIYKMKQYLARFEEEHV